MANMTHNNTNYIIKGTFSIAENALGDKSLLQVAVGSSSTITINPDQSTDYTTGKAVGYGADNNVRRWYITGRNTQLGTDDKFYVYVRCSHTMPQAQVFFSIYHYDIDGYRLNTNGERTGSSYDENNYYVEVGYVTAVQAGARECHIDTGCYGTNKEQDQGLLDIVTNAVTSAIAGIKSWISSHFLTKDSNDETTYTLTAGGLKTNDMKTKGYRDGDIAGAGAAMFQTDGRGYVVTDELKVRGSAWFRQLNVEEVRHIGGEHILSAASCTIARVQAYDADDVLVYDSHVEGNTGKAIAYFVCLFDTEANGRTQYNEWQVGDQALCKEFDLTDGGADGTVDRGYWRLVIDSSDMEVDGTTYHYVTLSNKTSNVNLGVDYVSGKGVTSVDESDPMPNDSLVLLGSRSRVNLYRRSAQMYSTAEANSPSRRYYHNIYSFDLSEASEIETLEYKIQEGSDGEQIGPHWRVGDDNGHVEYTREGLSIKAGSVVLQGTGKDLAELASEEVEVFMLTSAQGYPKPRRDGEFTPAAGSAEYDFGWVATEYRSHINALCVTADGIVYRWEKLDLTEWKWVLVTDKYLIDAMNNVDTLETSFKSITDDGKIIPSEKIAIRSMRDQVYAEHIELQSMKEYLLTNKPLSGKDDSWYEALGNGYTTYNNAYNNLMQDFDEIVASTGSVITVPQDMQSHITAYTSAVDYVRQYKKETNTYYFSQNDDMTKLGNTFFEKVAGAWVAKESGLVTTSDYAKLFSKWTDSEGNEHEALIETRTDSEGNTYAVMNAENINLTGQKMKFNSSQIEIDTDNFKLDGSGNVEVGGVVKAKAMYSNTTTVTQKDYVIDPTSGSSTCFMYSDIRISGTHITLPNATTYDGMSIDIFVYAADANYDGNLYHYVNTGGENLLAKVNAYRMQDGETQVVVERNNVQYSNGTYARMVTNCFYTFKAIGGQWVALRGLFTGE